MKRRCRRPRSTKPYSPVARFAAYRAAASLSCCPRPIQLSRVSCRFSCYGIVGSVASCAGTFFNWAVSVGITVLVRCTPVVGLYWSYSTHLPYTVYHRFIFSRTLSGASRCRCTHPSVRYPYAATSAPFHRDGLSGSCPPKNPLLCVRADHSTIPLVRAADRAS